ncbi:MULTISPECIES: hypothetical protein [unclassified Virgibacillus]|uniref:hypothetical protein n=1 Tax=unclassified Virgibacillus TaxID=2620237 RepID=UPI00090C0093|nr:MULTISPECIES: hypothetical protein [unclassified Virgibacillus]API93491.1 hypothetical protein BKP57_17760 [Virgibacillus sp. 6R]MBS7430122.1 hypothetical protein [Virgibacillus sp. 19R1-5]
MTIDKPHDQLLRDILPYINFNFNVVCTNPHETDADKVEPINIKQLAKALGFKSYRKLHEILLNIKVDNEPVFGFVSHQKPFKNTKIVVNACFAYNGDNDNIKAVELLFR